MAVLVERENIGIFGRMNAGKSSLMNLLTQQATSIVDATPGTTADTKVALFEIHGIGPVRLFDTAGIDEASSLGTKKRDKVLKDLKECDLVLLMIDPSRVDFRAEEELLQAARDLDTQILIIYNLFTEDDRKKIVTVEDKIRLLAFHKKIVLQAPDSNCRGRLIDFIIANYEPANPADELLPFIEKDEFYVLIIPMDDETPPGRYLRPQAMTEEYITRHWAYPVSFRLDLNAARGTSEQCEAEHKRFRDFLDSMQRRPKAMITDSQAMDVMKDWCPDDIDLTTFSIIMIQYMSGGRLRGFAEGVQVLDRLQSGDRILIAEACNHSRIGEDIGTVQIPRIIESNFPGVMVDHAFGREFQERVDLGRYALIIHCGGCMISRQKLMSRLRDLEAAHVPVTNYGVFLSAVQGLPALKKVLQPWEIDI